MVHGLEVLERINAEACKPQAKVAEFNDFCVDDRGEFARLLWEESTGRVILLTSFGDWSYVWGHRGKSSVRAFLCKLDSDYMAGKLLGASSHVMSDKLTINAIDKHILSELRAGSITRLAARDELEHLRLWSHGEIDYRGWLEGTKIEDACEFECHTLNPQWVSFWERLWVPVIRPALEAYAP